MKTKNGILAFTFALFLGANVFAAEKLISPKEKEVTVPVADVYIPSGFDSSTEAFVVVSGFFPNSCYQFKNGAVDHETARHHNVTTIATVREGICMTVLVPFTEEVSLGKLETGEHTLRFFNGDGTYFEKSMQID